MPEYLVRSGQLCAVVEAEGTIEAIHAGIVHRAPDDDPLELGAVIEVIDLAQCEAATTYFQSAATLAMLNFQEPDVCGLAVTTGSVS